VGEVVATIGNDGGVPSSEIGKVDIRDTHSIVEVSPAMSQQVIDKLTGKTMAGRRLVVRLDQAASDAPPAGRGGPRREGRPPRSGDKKFTPGEGRGRSDRPRPDRPRGDRPTRGGGRPR
jgi:ATP-dependent RNA helicase DeaD